MASVVTRTQLDNGLTVILKEMHHAPVITFMVWYRVGSRNEIPGRTGVSHWVEHMNFKGTTNIPRDQVKGIIEQLRLELRVDLLKERGVDAIISFRAMLLDLLDKIEVNQNYSKSDTLQVMRILKNYDLLKDTQLDLLPDRAPSRRPRGGATE